MSVCPIAMVLLNRGKNRDIYARAFLHLALMSVSPPTFWFFILFDSNSLQPLQVEYADFFLLLPGLD